MKDDAERAIAGLRGQIARSDNPLERRSLVGIVKAYEEAEENLAYLTARAETADLLKAYQDTHGDRIVIVGQPDVDEESRQQRVDYLVRRIMELGGDQAAIEQALAEVGFMPRKDTKDEQVAAALAKLRPMIPGQAEVDDTKALRDIGALLAETTDIDTLAARVFPRMEEGLADHPPEVAEAVREKIREQVVAARDSAYRQIGQEVQEDLSYVARHSDDLGIAPVNNAHVQFAQKMMDQILNRGATKQAAEEVMVEHGYDITDDPMQQDAICDLCSASAPGVAIWRTEPFEITNEFGIKHGYSNPWMACAPCDAAISAGDREALAQRAEASIDWDAMPKLVREATRRGMREIHDAFWANKTVRDDPPGIGKSTALIDDITETAAPDEEQDALEAWCEEMLETKQFAANAWTREQWNTDVRLPDGRVIGDFEDLRDDEFVFIADCRDGDGNRLQASVDVANGNPDADIEILQVDAEANKALVYCRGESMVAMFRRQVTTVDYRVFEARDAA